MNEEEKQYIIEEFKKFKWYYKDDFERWIYISFNKDSERYAYMGGTGGNYQMRTRVIVKQIKIKQNYRKILRELFFLSCLKNNKYFAEIIDVFLSDNNQNNQNNQRIYIVLREAGVSLNDYIIFFSKNNYLINFESFRFIVFQIACGLKILHDKGLLHNDIKPDNIVISGQGKTKICDMGNTDKESNLKFAGTNGYFSPQVLMGKEMTKNDDMWSLGVIYLELFHKKTGMFAVQTNKKIEDVSPIILEYILKKFYNIKQFDLEVNSVNTEYQMICNQIKGNNFTEFKYQLKPELLEVDGLNNEDKELIKKLLELNPEKRMNVDDFINSPMFHKYNYKFVNSEIYFKEVDYARYLGNCENFETFDKYIKEIKQKINGVTIFTK